MNTAPVDHFKKFIAEMRADPQVGAFADDMEKALQAIDLEGDGNGRAGGAGGEHVDDGKLAFGEAGGEDRGGRTGVGGGRL
jgi:hypothetical protein